MEKVRSLLDDHDADVRGIAIGVLARYHDEPSVQRFAEAVHAVKDAMIACKAIEELAARKDERTVPTLISFLTEHEFPFDVATSRKAWEEVQRINDKAERTRLLEKLAPGGHSPLIAAAIGMPSKKVIDASAKEPRVHGGDELVVAVRMLNI